MFSLNRVCSLGVGLILTLAATAGLSSDTAKPAPQVEWIRANAIPLKTVEAGHGFDDMMPLKRVVGDARVVGLGEATHGTREFFQLKHRMVEFLATQMGFTIFTIEANMPEAYRLNDYVLHGTGDPKELLRGMYFWTWQTEEVLDMIEWMREFNRSGKGHIEFTGFDMQTSTVAAEIVHKYVAEHDASYLATLEPIWQEIAKPRADAGGAFGVGTATFPVEIAAGHTITFSGYIKTENISRGFAGLWWRIDGEKGDNGYPKMLGFDNMNERGPRGTTPWTKYEIKMPVPANARHINFGVLHPGDGTAWFDSLKVEVDGVPFTDTSTFDLDFESATPRGFYTGGNGYQVGIDREVFHSGSQSLRSTFVTDDSEQQHPPDAARLAGNCSGVVRHLQELHSTVHDKNALKELEWATQNARVILQYVQLNGGIKTRDESMADNIKWIADQNPGAKIIVWAHNGHVAHGSTAGYLPMGSYLRKMFGRQYVNFGFAFNEGSFQAVEMRKSLHDFTVGPAPDGSLDSTLASAGLPIMALDLRTPAKDPATAEWLRAPHQTRSIGSAFSNDQTANYLLDSSAPEMFDALLFVEKTTAARKLAPPGPNR